MQLEPEEGASFSIRLITAFSYRGPAHSSAHGRRGQSVIIVAHRCHRAPLLIVACRAMVQQDEAMEVIILNASSSGSMAINQSEGRPSLPTMYIQRHELIRYLESRLPPLGSDKVEKTPLPSYTMLYVLQCCHFVTPAYGIPPPNMFMTS